MSESLNSYIISFSQIFFFFNSPRQSFLKLFFQKQQPAVQQYLKAVHKILLLMLPLTLLMSYSLV